MPFANRSFRARIALLTVLPALVIAIPSWLAIQRVHVQQMVALQGQSLQMLANAVADGTREDLLAHHADIQQLAALIAFDYRASGELDRDSLREQLNLLQQSNDAFDWLGFADRDAKVIAASGGIIEGANVRARPWFGEALSEEFIGTVHDAVLLASILGDPSRKDLLRFMDFAVPVIDANGSAIGVLAGHSSSAFVARATRVTSSDAAQGLEALVIDGDGHVLFPYSVGFVPPSAIGGFDGVRRVAWSDDTEFFVTSAKIHGSPLVDALDWQIMIRMPAKAILGTAWQLEASVFGTAALATLVFVLWVLLSARHLGQPLKEMAAVASAIAGGDTSRTFGTRQGGRELGELRGALQSMSTRLLAQAEDLQAQVDERTRELAEANVLLEQQANVDVLTGIANRRAAQERLAFEFARFRRSQEPFCVLMLDIDHFKQVNDIHGHSFGDTVLKAVAACLREKLRDTDFVGRTGGEEFLCILPGTHLAGGRHLGEKLRRNVAKLALPPLGEITVSVGVAEVGLEDMDGNSVVAHADERLYAAKAAGRDRVMAA